MKAGKKKIAGFFCGRFEIRDRRDSKKLSRVRVYGIVHYCTMLPIKREKNKPKGVAE